MTTSLRSRAVIGVAVMGILSCAAPPVRSPGILEEQYRLSSNHLFHYRPPAGWREAAPAADGDGVLLWLVSPDLKESLQIREVQMDAQAEEILQQNGLGALAQLMFRMERGDLIGGEADLRMDRIDGREFWFYEGQDVAGLRHGVSLFVASGRLLECRSVLNDLESASTFHADLLSALRW